MPLDVILSCKYDIYFRQGATVSAVNDWDFWALLFGFSTERNRIMFRGMPAQCPSFHLNLDSNWYLIRRCELFMMQLMHS